MDQSHGKQSILSALNMESMEESILVAITNTSEDTSDLMSLYEIIKSITIATLT